MGSEPRPCWERRSWCQKVENWEANTRNTRPVVPQCHPRVPPQVAGPCPMPWVAGTFFLRDGQVLELRGTTRPSPRECPTGVAAAPLSRGNPRDNKRLLHPLGLSVMGTQVTRRAGSAVLCASHASVPVTLTQSQAGSSPCAGVPLPGAIQTRVQVGITQGLYLGAHRAGVCTQRAAEPDTP